MSQHTARPGQGRMDVDDGVSPLDAGHSQLSLRRSAAARVPGMSTQHVHVVVEQVVQQWSTSASMETEVEMLSSFPGRIGR